MPSLPKDLFRKIRQLHIRTLRQVNDLFAGDYRSAFKGKGLEFAEVREYFPGDDVRSIDWNVTARMQQPYIKSFQEERELTVFLVVDISSSTAFGSSQRTKSELIAEIGAILAFSAIKNQDKVGLLLFSSEVELYLPPRKGLRHVLRLIRELLFFTPAHRGTDLQKALAFLGRVQKRHAICFILSDFLTSPYSHDALLLAKRHELNFVYIYDAYEKQFPPLGLSYLRDLETGELALVDTMNKEVQSHFQQRGEEQQAALKRFVIKIGASLISVRTDQSSAEALHQFFELRRRRH